MRSLVLCQGLTVLERDAVLRGPHHDGGSHIMQVGDACVLTCVFVCERLCYSVFMPVDACI
jgi:hypothetical protein